MMRTIKKYFYIFMTFAVIVGISAIMVKYYSYIFAKNVEGQVFEIRRVNQPNLVVGNASYVNPGIMHSYAVAIRTLDGKIITASGEDRKWEVVQKGICVKAVLYPYPPWNLEKGGEFSRARLEEMKECTAEYKQLSALPTDSAPQEMHESPPGAEIKAQPEHQVQ